MKSEPARARISMRMAASAPTVFAAWTEPKQMERWLFKSPTNHLLATNDLAVSGAFSVVEREGGDVIDHTGEYLVVDAPRELVFTLRVPKHFDGTARIEVRLAQVSGGTQLDFVALDDGPEDAQRLWEDMLGNLSRLIAHREGKN